MTLAIVRSQSQRLPPEVAPRVIVFAAGYLGVPVTSEQQESALLADSYAHGRMALMLDVGSDHG